jgi:hypothetical protein
MAKYTATFAADASLTYICDVIKPRSLTNWKATAVFYGDDGGGTTTLHVSPDGGTTKVPLVNTSNTAVSVTAPGTANLELGIGSTNSDALKIYATLTGSTNPAWTVAIFDNN